MYNKLSLIIVCWNNFDILIKYILPIVPKEVEIILCVNCTDKRYVDIINVYKNVKCFYTTSNNRAKARNLGAQNATGEILIFLDGDTAPNKALFKIASTCKLLEVYFAKRLETTTAQSLINNLMYLQLLNTNDSIHSLKWQEASSNCFIMHKKIFLKIKGFNERYKGWGYEDTDLFLQAHKYGCSLILHSGIEVWHISHEEFFYKRFIDSFKNLIRFTIFNFIDVFNIDFILRAYNLQIYMLEMGIRQLLLKREATK